eukprot:1080019-Prorocentrum_minimum.AAC.1
MQVVELREDVVGGPSVADVHHEGEPEPDAPSPRHDVHEGQPQTGADGELEVHDDHHNRVYHHPRCVTPRYTRYNK